MRKLSFALSLAGIAGIAACTVVPPNAGAVRTRAPDAATAPRLALGSDRHARREDRGPAPERYTLELEPGGAALLRADCNRGRGSYEIGDGQIRLGRSPRLAWRARPVPSTAAISPTSRAWPPSSSRAALVSRAADGLGHDVLGRGTKPGAIDRRVQSFGSRSRIRTRAAGCATMGSRPCGHPRRTQRPRDENIERVVGISLHRGLGRGPWRGCCRRDRRDESCRCRMCHWTALAPASISPRSGARSPSSCTSGASVSCTQAAAHAELADGPVSHVFWCLLAEPRKVVGVAT